MIKITVHGGGGKMGRAIIEVIAEDESCSLFSAIEREDSPLIGKKAFNDIPYTTLSKGNINNTDVIIDFSSHSAVPFILSEAIKEKKPIVIGTTGLDEKEKEKIKEAALKIPIVFAPNMSIGVNLLFKLTKIAAETLRDDFDVEIVEAHHKHKKDAPSGTAVKLTEIVVETLKRDFKKDVCFKRHGIIGERPKKEIGVQTIRGGDVAGEHTVFFFGSGERIELIHRAGTRKIFARGAVKAAKWIIGKEEPIN